MRDFPRWLWSRFWLSLLLGLIFFGFRIVAHHMGWR